MDLKLSSEHAKQADNIVSAIKETGKYIGVITRAESLVSRDKGTKGLGLSFKADNGQTADYLDIYHTKGDGSELSGLKTVNAILCCTRTQEAKAGKIKVEKWDADAKARVEVTVDGYPQLMGKRIGFLLQKALETDQNGRTREKVQIFGVFAADTELTASEMYAKKTTPERLNAMFDALMARPVRDNRTHAARKASAAAGGDFDDRDIPPPSDDDCPF